MSKNKIVCIVGMPGAGKSVVADWLVEKKFKFYRFGQVVLDYFVKSGKKPTEKEEKKVREGLRKKDGMAAIAKALYPKFKKALEKSNVVADGLYSFSEYKYLKKRLKDQMIVVAVFAPPSLRYERISIRKSGKKDKNLRHRPFTKKEAKERDYNEIENIEKGGPIAMADYTFINTKDLCFLKKQFDHWYEDIFV